MVASEGKNEVQIAEESSTLTTEAIVIEGGW